MTTTVLHTAADLAALPRRGRRAVVMTMGALHQGHAELIRVARRHAGDDGSVIVTVFVNPTQFGAGEDFERYPRTLDDDVVMAADAGADIVFAPDADEVYGPARGFSQTSVTIDPGPLGDILEGAARPGHFRGVLTVVAKLMAMTQPDAVMFGEKDYQQLVLVRRMVRDLSMGIEVVPVPTVRELDGFALSSRNRYLSADERRIAQALPRALDAAIAAAPQGATAAEEAGLAVLDGLDVDYLVVTDPELGSAPESGPARVIAAVRVGTTRLIDNRPMVVGA